MMSSSQPRAFCCVALLLLCALLLPFLAAAGSPADTPAKLDSDMLDGILARAIGPAVMSGRIAAIAGIPGDRVTLYVGAASGGVWKSQNGGLTFKPVFDKYTQSIGAIAIDPNHPEIVWVGTGESWTRNSVSVGTGLYKSADAGESWQLVGLPDSEHISAIAINPKESNTVLVCALGHLWNANAERGVFRTTDSGKTWTKVLFVNNDTGCSSVSIDPQDPQVAYAGMWQVRRYPWTFNSGGPGSGLYKSTDGGATWKHVTKGLPEGILGRVGVAVAPSRPSTVYAVVEAKKTGLYRSDDLGESWTLTNSGADIQARPFYFGTIIVDPKDYNRVYKPGYFLGISDDGGKTFSSVGEGFGGGAHGDYHALWINPRNTDELVLGTDGGVYISSDRAAHWRMVGSLPVSQFYHVAYDMQRPYNVYGGLQDNGTWMGPSHHSGGIAERHWTNLVFGDGFWAFPDPADGDIVYGEWQGGKMRRVVKSLGESKSISPFPETGETKLRFNWNTPIHVSSSNGGTIYIGAQYLFRSRDRGESWDRISPDLTTNEPEKLKQEESGGLTRDNSDAENHCTIYAISESPKNPALVWVGTDDGNLQLTRDGGKTWTNVVANVTGLPTHTWVSYVDASRYDEGTAYATFDGHAMGDLKPYVYRTRDFGKTWQPLMTDDVHGYAHVVREDIVKPNLLFLGTEFGLFVSIDSGANWAQLKGNMPPVAVRDVAIHPRDNDLLVATHGRGIWVVDDLTPLRSLTAEVIASEVSLLPSRPATLTVPAFEQRFDGDSQFVGYSPEASASIAYYLQKRHMFGDLRLEIYDSTGKMVYSAPGSRRKGLNRFDWPLRLKAPKVPPAASLFGGDPFVLFGPLATEGTYKVKMIKGDKTYSTELQLVADPRSPHTAAERKLGNETVTKLYDMLGQLTYVADAVSDLQSQATARSGKLPQNDPVRKRLEGLNDSLESLRKTLVATKEGALTGEIRLRERILELYGAVNGYDGAPTKSQLRQVTVLAGELNKASTQFDSTAAKEVPALNPTLEKKKLQPLKPLTHDDWEKKQKT